uniref:BTB domain-containing protein n=1 Tax=Alexandrium catenella TaxID=2925 RepID=A0A7S1WUC1_ALECA|mmetsp:Transcript_91286/g.242485  ORF Transcript_91286/g.242485 Transcript_91286/m.242485 type:complete len:589 (+) Transcript_91286:149-1915(+)
MAEGSMESIPLLPTQPANIPQARRAARVDVPFPELPSDADTEIPSWRTGLHSDWQLRLGQTEYRIHKVLTGHGPRASAFLCSAFTTGQQLAAGCCLEESRGSSGGCIGETDLSNILPEQVWPVFGEVLDYVYSEELHLTDENAVPLLRCADVLQIRSLFLLCVEGINELLSVTAAPKILGDSVGLLGGALAEQIQKAAQDVIAEHFDAYSVADLQRIPTTQLVQILKRDDLNLMHENEVFDRVLETAELLNSEDRKAEVIQLWQTVRFGALSNSYVIRASQVEAIPKMVLIWAKVLHRKCGSSMLQSPTAMQTVADGWPVGPPRPRKPFKDLVCAVMYSVDTDARNDQDVERNITAATLVAEEIEFLGGRAILENIFARSPSARENSEASIINMDQVDVAFVLAPWTPSDKRITKLINFVDQGGGAVLLSFIGGLSKGTWLDRQYEPLITGKVADTTPYEDVYLATPATLESDLKRSQDTLTPPRILCGVDSINGRRRITSKLVEGAKVLAKWSDGQPLVVQHPDKNVFSVSQRVSRIFELDDDLGHDDTLQLVLNVMVQAGKEAKRLRGSNDQASSFMNNGGVNVSL